MTDILRDCSEEIRRRIRVAVWAYAYEVEDEPLATDAEFDAECLKVRPHMRTSYKGRDNRELDRFFREVFSPDTGMWIHKHPDLAGVKRIHAQIANVSRAKRSKRA